MPTRAASSRKAQILDHVWDYDFGGDARVRGDVHQLPAQEARPRTAAADPHGARLRLRAARAGTLSASLRARLHRRRCSPWSPSGSAAPLGGSPTLAQRSFLVDRVDDQARDALGRPGPALGASPAGRLRRRGTPDPARPRRRRRRPAARLRRARTRAHDARGRRRGRPRRPADARDGRRRRARRRPGQPSAIVSPSTATAATCHRAPRGPGAAHGRPGTTWSRSRSATSTRRCTGCSLIERPVIVGGAARARPCSRRGWCGSACGRSSASAATAERDRRRRPLAPRRPTTTPHRGRAPGRGAQRDARPPRDGVRRARGVGGAAAPVRRRRLPRAADPAHLDPRLRRAVPHGRARNPEDLDLAMARIEEEAARMGVLVDDLLMLARLDEGRDAAAGAGRPGGARPRRRRRRAGACPDRPIDARGRRAGGGGGRRRPSARSWATSCATRVVHTPPGTPVTVRVRARTAAAWSRWPTAAPAWRPTTPRGCSSASSAPTRRAPAASGGSGLGLSIVAAMARPTAAPPA